MLTNNKKIVTFSIVGTLLLAAVAIGKANIQPAYAQGFGDGASVFAPGQIVGPDLPGQTDESAPGKIIGPDNPSEISPGQKGLDAQIIGPDIKKIP